MVRESAEAVPAATNCRAAPPGCTPEFAGVQSRSCIRGVNGHLRQPSV